MDLCSGFRHEKTGYLVLPDIPFKGFSICSDTKIARQQLDINIPAASRLFRQIGAINGMVSSYLRSFEN
jgi:hypothetical protein